MPGRGACVFPFDPDRPVDGHPAFWDAAVATSVVIVDPGPDFPELAAPGMRRHAIDARDGCHLVLRDRRRTWRVWLRAPAPASAFHLPRDPHFSGRLRATASLQALLSDMPAPEALPDDLSAFRRARLDVMLTLLDAKAQGASLRSLARIAYPATMAMPTPEWKGSSERRGTMRLLAEALALRNGGYRKLLAGS